MVDRRRLFLRADGVYAEPTVSSGGTGGGPHHATHEPGGSDALVNAAWTTQPNVFTAPQRIESAAPQLALVDPAAPVDARRWELQNSFESLSFYPNNDAGTSDANPIPLALDRLGNVYSDGVLTAGGGLGTTPLDASQLLTGTVPDARLSANVQLKPIAPADLPAHHTTHEPGGSDPVQIAESQVTNLTADLAGKVSKGTGAASQVAVFQDADTVAGTAGFTFDQVAGFAAAALAGANGSRVALIDPSQAANQRQFRIQNSSQLLAVQANDDAGGLTATPLTIRRTGAVDVGGALKAVGDVTVLKTTPRVILDESTTNKLRVLGRGNGTLQIAANSDWNGSAFVRDDTGKGTCRISVGDASMAFVTDSGAGAVTRLSFTTAGVETHAQDISIVHGAPNRVVFDISDANAVKGRVLMPGGTGNFNKAVALTVNADKPSGSWVRDYASVNGGVLYLDVDNLALQRLDGAGSTNVLVLDLATGKLTVATAVLTGGQLQFPATAVPSTDLNTLDDYREVPFTPALTGASGGSGQIYTTQQGLLVKKGRDCTFSGQVTTSAIGTLSGSVRITGLPVACHTSLNGAVVFGYFTIGVAVTWLTGLVRAGQSYIELFYLPSGGAASVSAVTQSQLANFTDLNFVGAYMAAS